MYFLFERRVRAHEDCEEDTGLPASFLAFVILLDKVEAHVFFRGFTRPSRTHRSPTGFSKARETKY